MQISKIKYQNDQPKLKKKAKNKFTFWFLAGVFGFWILIFGFVSIIGCAGQQVKPVAPVSSVPTEYEVLLSAEDAWRAVLRFSDKNDYQLLSLDSDQGLLEISSGDLDASSYSAYTFHYAFLFVGLEKGTKIVIAGSFHNSDGKEVPVNSYLEKMKKENEYRILTALKNYFETELNNGSGKRALP
ncbi:MAG: hypothetical protein HY920_00130 [Elusimicrobia bacterium]|nr:hypothetical protein [Elusimicrobiota bacterium]